MLIPSRMPQHATMLTLRESYDCVRPLVSEEGYRPPWAQTVGDLIVKGPRLEAAARTAMAVWKAIRALEPRAEIADIAWVHRFLEQ
jgi:hypothetical protein